VIDFPLPDGLARLLATGVWPSAAGPSKVAQERHPIISADRVAEFAAEQTLICLQPPPFPTIAEERAKGGSGKFWERHGALHQIDPKRALIIGDFGFGSDSPIVLDYARNRYCPPVLRLRWGAQAQGNEWVQGAGDFDEFAKMLGLA
jgi:hypothetical protein